MGNTSGNHVLQKITDNREEIACRFSVTRIGLFGSFVRGEERADSDVDILVEFAEPTFDRYMDLKFYLEDILEHRVDLVMAETLKPRIKSGIKRETVYV